MKSLSDELKSHNSICFYPSCGTDLSDLDYFASGCRPREERKTAFTADLWTKDAVEPDCFIHTDVNFYMEFEAGEDFDLSECGIHGEYQILSFEELEKIQSPNRINKNLPFTGQCFKYVLKLWGKEKPVTLIFCICENEYLVSQFFLNKLSNLNYIWCKNWNGGQTHGTWLANAANALGVKYFYTDWLCLPGLRGEPSNFIVFEKYPDLLINDGSNLIRTNNHWIEEGAHGWVDEFSVLDN